MSVIGWDSDFLAIFAFRDSAMGVEDEDEEDEEMRRLDYLSYHLQFSIVSSTVSMLTVQSLPPGYSMMV